MCCTITILFPGIGMQLNMIITVYFACSMYILSNYQCGYMYYVYIYIIYTNTLLTFKGVCNLTNYVFRILMKPIFRYFFKHITCW